MQNINELIGIIKGINFDGVINDKEVLRLQSWVDKNRNLAYDKQQMELIKMVDSVLEDHIIDDSEKELLITACEEFLKDAGDNSSRIYELNGIIEGVVCDGEVNEAEVLRLKEWMDDYGDSIRDHKPSAELCKAIDDILEERGVELCGEFQRWFDLKRTGKLVEYVKKYNAQGSANIDSHHLYRPIPDAETNSVTNLTTDENSTTGFWQNKGY